jgi:hypothetical protein
MIPDELIDQIKAIRDEYLSVLEGLLDEEGEKLRESSSFASICNTSPQIRERFEKLRIECLSDAIQQDPKPIFKCAIIGSSNHGKTSVVAEMFPDLQRKKLLITDVKDTTAQALIIKPGTSSHIVFNPWTLDQIKYLIQISEDALQKCGIKVDHRGEISVDASDSDLDKKTLSSFRFGIRQKIKPFFGTYQIDASKNENISLIERLTTKLDYSQTKKPDDIIVNGESFNDLQFRVAVRSANMESDFSEIHRWLDNNTNSTGISGDDLTFIDTPGLRVGGSANDEVLQHVLANKNQQIVVELLKNDELDFIIHLVLCGWASDFSSLWSKIQDIDPEILQDIGDRVIIAINGFNMYFENADLRERWESRCEGSQDDHFNVTIHTNILSKMSDRGTLKPLNICFMDVRRVIEAKGVDYKDYYRDKKKIAESWATPSGVGHSTLKRLGILEGYLENLEAICDPDDCGKGYLVRQIAEALMHQGPKLIIRRFLVRNKLIHSIREIRLLLSESYNADGQMTIQHTAEVLKNAIAFLNAEKPDGIDLFCKRDIDPFLPKIIDKAIALQEESLEKDNRLSRHGWTVHAFRFLILLIFDRIKINNKSLNPDVLKILHGFFESQCQYCVKAWGYSTADLPPPSADDQAPRYLIEHALKYHSREFLYKCIQTSSSGEGLLGVMQDEMDRENMKDIMNRIQGLQVTAERICSSYGVVIK